MQGDGVQGVGLQRVGAGVQGVGGCRALPPGWSLLAGALSRWQSGRGAGSGDGGWRRELCRRWWHRRLEAVSMLPGKVTLDSSLLTLTLLRKTFLQEPGPSSLPLSLHPPLSLPPGPFVASGFHRADCSTGLTGHRVQEQGPVLVHKEV